MNSKSAILAKKIARELLIYGVNEKIPTVANLAEKYSVGIGTIDKVLNNFKENNAIELQSRGKMGTYLIKKDFIKLCEAAGNKAFVGLLPLPNSNEYECLATSLSKTFQKSQIPFSIHYKNGAKARLKSLMDERCDYIVTSNFAAENICKENDDIIKALDLKNCNYYSNFYIIHNKRKINDKVQWRVGLDETSTDSIYLTNGIFKENEKISLNYYNFPYAIVDGKIDAAVIHSKMFIPLELVNRLKINKINNFNDNFINNYFKTTILAKRNNIEVTILFNEFVDISYIENIYKNVLERKIEPSF